MNPTLNFRGPTPMVAIANSLENQEAIGSAPKKGLGIGKSVNEAAIQRKLSENEEGMSTESDVNSSFESKLNNAKGGGEKMTSGINGTMSAKFNTNFSNVNIHNNSRSHKLANQINAKAFTVGEDIYFNEGEYAPNTKKGQHLLAHELTHTVQQKKAGSSIQKKSKNLPRKDLQVEGVQGIGEQKMDKIYFEKGGSEMDFLQELKVASFFMGKKPPKEIYLYGYASEEGSKSSNKKLISKRLSAVAKAIKRYSKIKVKVHPFERLGESVDSYKYREFRSVEMSTVPIAATNGVSNRTDRDCTKIEKAEIEKRRATAVTDVDNALKLIKGYFYAPKSYKDVGALMDLYFGGHSNNVIAHLLLVLGQMKTDLPRLKGNTILRCAGFEHAYCNKAYALASKQTDILFCPKFFNAKEATFKTRILIHELGHFIPRNLRDYAYAHSRVFRFTSPADALKNSDSYTMLINDVNKHKIVSKKNTLRDPVGDVVSGCDIAKQPIVEEALSRAERLNSLAVSGFKQTYVHPTHLEDMTPGLKKEFGKINKYSLAGLYDRSNKIKGVYRRRKFKLNCLPANSSPCSKTVNANLNSKHIIDVCPSFFKLSKANQIIAIGAEVTKFVPEIQDKYRQSYVRIGTYYKKNFWKL